jgi:hypothetical protein
MQGLFLKIGKDHHHLALETTMLISSCAEIFPDDEENNRVLQWFYNDIAYNSTEAFRTAWESPDFEKLAPNLDGEWTDTEDFGNALPARGKPPPVMIQPSGPRYNIDLKENFISWSTRVPVRFELTPANNMN